MSTRHVAIRPASSPCDGPGPASEKRSGIMNGDGGNRPGAYDE